MANSTAERQIVSLKIVHTSDVHGSFFMRDYVNNHAVRGSLSRVYAYVQSLRKAYGDRLLLMDGGDILQGSPVVYYSNFVASSGKNLAAALGEIETTGLDKDIRQAVTEIMTANL